MVVQLKNGNVKSFFVSRKEPNAVTNIKKVFLSQISHDSSETAHTAFKPNPNHWSIEFLRNESITAKLPLTRSKNRKENSLLPTSSETTSPGEISKHIFHSLVTYT